MREQAVAELVDLHVTALAGTNPVDVASTDRHTVKPWFQGRLPFTFNLPDLGNSGYQLLGGRMANYQHSPAAQLIYTLRKHELSVLIFQDGNSASQGPATSHENGFTIESWSRGGLRYGIVSDAGSTDVHALGELLRGAATPSAGP
jgi:anti-sigma factor RsiW